MADAPPSGLINEDIISNPERGARAGILHTISGAADRKEEPFDHKLYVAAIESLEENAREGFAGDYLIGELGSRGITRVRFQTDDKGNILTDGSGNPLIALDRVKNLATRIVTAAFEQPQSTSLVMGEGISDVPLNETRVCITAYSSVMMSLPESVSAVGQPKEAVDAALAKYVADDRAAMSDADLKNVVLDHLKNPDHSHDIYNAAVNCGFLGMRQMYDEGFRYEGQQMVIDPTTTSGGIETDVPAKKAAIVR